MKKILIFSLTFFLFITCKKDAFEEEIVTIVFYNIVVSTSEGGSVDTTGGSKESGSSFTISATPNEEYLFAGWTGTSSIDNPLTITANSNLSITANFEKRKYLLTIDVDGEGTVQEQIINPGKSTEYDSGSMIRLTAFPLTEWRFISWSGDYEGEENPIDINLTQPKNITALFEKLDPIYLDENGITIKANDFVRIGGIYNFNGIDYTIVDYNLLERMARKGEDLSKVVTSKVTNMAFLFSTSSSFNQDIGNWDTTNVTDMRRMFYGSSAFNRDIGNWDTSAVIDMGRMFNSASKFNQNIGSWDTSKVKNMYGMFYDASSFNQGISNITLTEIVNWNTSSVIDMGSMFYGAVAFNQDISNWNTSNVTNMTEMFRSTSTFNQNISGWCVSNISYEPYEFSINSALDTIRKPAWGTCPTSSFVINVSLPSSGSANTNYFLIGSDRNATGFFSDTDPNLTFSVSDTINFIINASGHPFYLKTVAEIGIGDTISGVTNNGAESGIIVWKPTATGTFYYQCSLHGGMVGTITIQ